MSNPHARRDDLEITPGPGSVGEEPRLKDEPLAAPREPYPPAPAGHVELEAVEARQATTLGRTRYILAASLFTIALIFLIIWLVIARL